MSDSARIAQLTARLEQLEAQAAIRTLMADYLRLCDRLDAFTPMDELRDLFTLDASWAGTGARYATAFGAHQGRAAILAMFETYRSPPHFVFNAHFLTSERIMVTGDAAEGQWMMLQTATYSTGLSDLRSARLRIDFARQDERWRIHRFETENLFSRAVDRWDDAAAVPVPVPVPGSVRGPETESVAAPVRMRGEETVAVQMEMSVPEALPERGPGAVRRPATVSAETRPPVRGPGAVRRPKSVSAETPLPVRGTQTEKVAVIEPSAGAAAAGAEPIEDRGALR